MKQSELLTSVINNLGNILTRSVMETCSKDFPELADKMSENIIVDIMKFLKQKDIETFNENVELVNYLLVGKLKTPYLKFKL